MPRSRNSKRNNMSIFNDNEYDEGLDDFDMEAMMTASWKDIYANSFIHIEFIMDTPVPEKYKMKGFKQWRY